MLYENSITPEDWKVMFVFGKNRGILVGLGNVLCGCFCTRWARGNLRYGESIWVKNLQTFKNFVGGGKHGQTQSKDLWSQMQSFNVWSQLQSNDMRSHSPSTTGGHKHSQWRHGHIHCQTSGGHKHSRRRRGHIQRPGTSNDSFAMQMRHYV